MGPRSDQPRGVQYATSSANLVTLSSVSHLVADTYPYRPGTIIRTGNPCSSGSGSPFIPTASSASRLSVRTSSGVPAVQPSVLRDSTMSAPASAPPWPAAHGRANRASSALPIRSPPTSLDTQAMVTCRSVRGLASSAAKSSSTSRSTMPVTLSVHSRGSITGDGEGGVDPVEIPVRGDERAIPSRPISAPAGMRRGPRTWGRQPEGAADLADAGSASPPGGGEGASHQDGRCGAAEQLQEAAPVRAVLPGRCPRERGAAAFCQAASRQIRLWSSSPPMPAASTGSATAVTVTWARVRTAATPTMPKAANNGGTGEAAAQLQHSGHGREDCDHQGHAGQQRYLVRGAEKRNRPILDSRRNCVNDGAAQRRHGRQ